MNKPKPEEWRVLDLASLGLLFIGLTVMAYFSMIQPLHTPEEIDRLDKNDSHRHNLNP